MSRPFEWSKAMESILWGTVGKKILNDPRTDLSDGSWLGYPFDVIREKVLRTGLTDFQKGHEDPRYGSLTAEEKVDLYCFVNLKKHFFACTATYEANSSLMNRCLSSSSVPVILDVGCGPGTALLALADRFGGIRAHYFGIDQSSAMRAKAHTLWKAARSWGLIHKTSKATYVESWNDLGTEATDPNAGVLVLFSYLFASHTLTWKILKSLATFVRRLADSRRNGPLVWVYVNSSQPFAGKNYEIFEHELGLQPSSLRPAVVEYRKKRGGDVAKEEYVGEVVRVGG